jgi:hypothetical protein
MDNVEFDEEDMKDLDSSEEDPEFHKFLNEIIEGKQGKKGNKSQNKTKLGKETVLMQEANQLYYDKKNDEAMEKAKEAILAAPNSSAPFHLMCKLKAD